MGLHRGTNNGNCGKAGASGRKSAYQELADAMELHRMWNEESDIQRLEEKIRSKKISVKDVYRYKALLGKERILSQLIDKLFPSKTDITTKGEAIDDKTSQIADSLTEIARKLSASKRV